MHDPGYLPLSRRMFDGRDVFWSAKEPFDRRSAWVDLCQLAQFGAREVLIGDVLVELDRGQFIASERWLAERWHWSKTTVHRYLKLLESMDRIRFKADKKADQGGALITLCNYPIYNPAPNESGPATDQLRTSYGPIKNKGRKKVTTNGVYSMEFEEAWDLYPERTGDNKRDAWLAWSARIREGVAGADMIAGTERYHRYVVGSKVERQFVKRAATFYGPSRHFAEGWEYSTNGNGWAAA